MRFTPRCALVFALWVGGTPLAIGQTCPVTLPTDGSGLGYRYRSSAPRCEGTFMQPVAGGPGFSLVSLTIGRVTYRLDQDTDLLIRLANPAAAETRIRAVGLPLQRYYRLDTILDSKRPELRVPLAEVLRPARIPAEDLGVFGLRQVSATGDGYVPVQAGAPGTIQTEGVTAIFRPGANVTGVRWRLVPESGSATEWQPVIGGAGFVPEGMRLAITFPATPMASRAVLYLTFYLQGVPETNRFTLLRP